MAQSHASLAMPPGMRATNVAAKMVLVVIVSGLPHATQTAVRAIPNTQVRPRRAAGW